MAYNKGGARKFASFAWTNANALIIKILQSLTDTHLKELKFFPAE